MASGFDVGLGLFGEVVGRFVEKGGDLLWRAALGFRQNEHAKQDADEAESAKHPEGAGVRQAALHVQKDLRHDEGCGPVGKGHDGAAGSLESGRHHFARDEPRQRSDTDGEDSYEAYETGEREPAHGARGLRIVVQNVKVHAHDDDEETGQHFGDEKQNATSQAFNKDRR